MRSTAFIFVSVLMILMSLNLSAHILPLENAKILYKQQQQEKAFQAFLEALVLAPIPELSKTSAEEAKLYGHALEVYLTAKNDKLGLGSLEILSQYVSVIELHPEYGELAFIVAAAYANQGDYIRFFDLFYQAYTQNPNHYLAHKTLAILLIKLFERALPGEGKEQWRLKILFHLDQARDLYPADIAINRLMILYAPLESRSKYVAESLKKIIQGDTVIPRTDLEFYVQQALTLNDIELIQSFLDKASRWYHVSRILTSAQQQLQNHLQKKSLERASL